MSLRLRIAMLAIHSSPLGRLGTQDTGGMSVYLLEMARELGKYGHQIDIFTRATISNSLQVIAPMPNVRIVHLDVAGTISLPPAALYEYTSEFVAAIMDFCQKADISYQLIHSNYWVSGVVGQRLKSVWHCPHLVTFHTFGAAKMAAHSNHYEDDKRLTEEALLQQHCDGIIVATAAEGKHLVSARDSKAQQIHVIPCGVNLDHFKPADLSYQQHQKKANDEPFMLLFVGRFDAMKGIDLLLASFSHLPSVPAVNLTLIGGDGPGTPDYEQIINHAQGLGISNLIHMLGSIDHHLMPRYYQAADAVVVTSHYESYGLVILEALASGTPVVSTPVGVAPQIIQPGVNGYLADTADSQKFAEAITRTMQLAHQQDPIKISNSVSEFSWSRVARLLRNVYSDTILITQENSTDYCHGQNF